MLAGWLEKQCNNESVQVTINSESRTTANKRACSHKRPLASFPKILFNVHEFLSASVDKIQKLFEMESTILKERICSSRSKFFPLRV